MPTAISMALRQRVARRDIVSSGRSRRKLKLRKRKTARAEMICGLTSRIGGSDFSCYHAIAARFVGHSEAVPDVPAVRPSEWLMRNPVGLRNPTGLKRRGLHARGVH